MKMKTQKRQLAIKMREHYSKLLDKLLDAQIQLSTSGGVKSYTIGDRQLTRYDLGDIDKQIQNCLEKINEYDRILNGKSVRQTGHVIPTDL